MNFYNIFNYDEFIGSEHTFFKKIRNLFNSFLISFFLVTIVLFIVIYPLDYLVTDFFNFQSIKKLMFKKNMELALFPFYLIVFVVPFFEEILFRLCLKLNRLYISIFFGLLAYLIFGGKIISFNLNDGFFNKSFFMGIFFFLISYYFLPAQVLDSLSKYKKEILILSILSFGIIHIFNISTFYWHLFIFYPFYVLPQMIMGYFISNVRLKYGFFWGFMLHALINTFPILLAH